MNLYTITEDYRAILAAIESGKIPEEQSADVLEQMGGEWEDKARAVAAFILNLRAEALAIGNAIKAMQSRQASTERKADNLLDYLQTQMQRANKAELKTPEWVAKFRKNPPRVIIANESLVPANLMTTPTPPKPTPNKSAIKKYLTELGKDEVCTWARLEQSERLDLK